jgi:hypothetical protein
MTVILQLSKQLKKNNASADCRRGEALPSGWSPGALRHYRFPYTQVLTTHMLCPFHERYFASELLVRESPCSLVA